MREHYFLKCRELEKENEQLKQTNQELNDELQKTMSYLSLKSGIERENEQLKQKYRKLQIDFNDVCGIVYDLRESKLDLEDEIEQLKSENQSWLKTASRMDIIHHEDREYCERIHMENEQLKQSVKRQQSSNEECSKYIEEFAKENEQLKSKIEELKELVVDIDPDYYEELYGDVE